MKKEYYKPGDPWIECASCRRKVRRSELKLDWLKRWVCPEDWDPKPAELDFYKRYRNKEGQPVREAQGRTTDQFETITDPDDIHN